MDGALEDYLYGRETPANAIYGMRIAIPPLILSETCPEGFTAEIIRKIFNLLPVEEIELDLNNSLETQNEILTALTHGHYLAHVRIHNCIDPIISLPTTVTAVELHTEREIPLIKNVVKMENVKKISIIGGRIDMQTSLNIMDRTTWLEELNLFKTSITTNTGLVRAASKIMEIKVEEINISGRPSTQNDVNRILYGEEH